MAPGVRPLGGDVGELHPTLVALHPLLDDSSGYSGIGKIGKILGSETQSQLQFFVQSGFRYCKELTCVVVSDWSKVTMMK